MLPLSQPYHIAPWNYKGNEKLPSYSHFPQNTVDWILLELRDIRQIDCILAQKAALLRSDGSIVNFEKYTEGIVFENVDNTDFYVVIRHRNHIDIVSKNIISAAKTTYYNKRFLLKKIDAKDYEKHLSLEKSALFSGDADGNNVISVRDFEYFQKEYGKKNTYSFFDFNLDGQVNEIDLECYFKNATEIGMKEIRY